MKSIASEIGSMFPWTMRALALAAKALPKGVSRNEDSLFVDWFTKNDIATAAASDIREDAERILKDMELYSTMMKRAEYACLQISFTLVRST